MEKASFKAEVGRNQFLDIYVFPLSPVELYQLLEQRGRDWDWKSSRNPNVLSLCTFPWNPVKYPTWRSMFSTCSIIAQPPAFQWLHLFSSTSFPGVTACTPTAPPSIPEFLPLQQIPPDCHIKHSNQAEQRRKSRKAQGGSQSKLSPHTWRQRTSFHMQRPAPFSTSVSKIGINY